MRARRRWLASAALTATLPLLCISGAAAQSAPPGAASCSGCHPPSATATVPIPPLVGRAADGIVTAMRDYRAGKLQATVMDRIAKGFTDDEITAIATWFAAQPQPAGGARP